MKNIIALLFMVCCGACNAPQPKTNDQLFANLRTRFEKNAEVSDDSAVSILNELNANASTKDPRIHWLTAQIKGGLFLRQSNYEKALYNYTIAEKRLLNIPNTDTFLIKTYNGISNCYKWKANHTQAIAYALKAKKIAEQLAIEKTILGINTNLAQLYLLANKDSDALVLLNESIKHGTVSVKLITMHTLANYYGERGLIDSALSIDNKAMQIGKKYPLLLSPIYNNKALCFVEKKNIDSALCYLQKSYTIDSLNKHRKNMAANIELLGNIYELSNDDVRAELTYKKALQEFDLMGNKKNAAGVFMMLKQLAVKHHNWQLAYAYKDSATSILKQIDNANIANNIALLNIDYETEKKNATIAQQSETLANKNNTILLLLAIVLLASVLVWYAYKNHTTKTELKLQNQQQNAALQIIAAEQKERMRIAQELHDGIGQKLTVLKMYASVDEHKNTLQLNLLNDTINEVRSISHKMMPEIINLGLIPALKDLCEKINVAKLVTCSFTIDETSQKLTLASDIELSIYRIVQEVLNNMLKHAQAKKISINIATHASILTIEINDDGKGFNTKAIHASSGIGWGNIITRAKIIKATVDVASSAKGTNIVLNINV
ncbi:MAG: histidine kinase [Bacteroidia bacterium]